MTFTNEAIATEDLPAFESVTLTPMPKASMTVNMISTAIFFIILTLVVCVLGLIGNIPNYTTFLAYWVPGMLGVLILSLWWIYLSHQYRGYAIREHDILYKSGVIWRKTTILPFIRIQHVETQQGVLQRKFDLAKLQLFTAGGQRADLTINGMELAITEGIKSRLLKKIQSENFAED